MKQQQSMQALRLMCEEVNAFMCDVIFDSTSEGANFSTRIDSDGTHIKLMICNGKTQTIVGKAFQLMDFITLCLNKGKMEVEINAAVKLMIAKSQTVSRKPIWI